LSILTAAAADMAVTASNAHALSIDRYCSGLRGEAWQAGAAMMEIAAARQPHGPGKNKSGEPEDSPRL
jgi:hypothetical protein